MGHRIMGMLKKKDILFHQQEHDTKGRFFCQGERFFY